jgi:HK97 family phage major capsid protein
MARLMSVREKSIREQRATVYGGMADLMEKFNENGSLDAEETVEYDRREKELRHLDADLKRIVDFNKLNDARENAADTAGTSRDEFEAKTKSDHARAFSNYLRHGIAGLAGEDRRALVGLEQRVTNDANALYTVGGASNAGFLVPQGFWQNLQVALKQFGGLLNVAKIVETSTGNPMPWPTTDPTAIVGNYVGAQGTQLGFQDYVFGQGMMNAWTITSNVALASIEAINDTAFDVETFVRERIGESIGRFVAAELHTGSGSSALLGLKTALTAYGVKTGAQGGVYQPTAAGTVTTIGHVATPLNKLTGATPGFDDVIAMTAKIDPAYRASGRCTWVMNDNTQWKIRSITDAQGHPLWNPNVQVGGDDRIYGYPVLIDQNIGDISTSANADGGMYFGDFQTCMVVRQVNQAGVMRLDERYADFLQVGFLGFVRMDSRSNDLRAVSMYRAPAS